MKRLLGIVVALCLIATGEAHGQSAKDAFKELKRIEAKVEVGITYQKYREALGDANVELKLFLESPAAKEVSELSVALTSAMEKYRDAGDLWALTIETRRVPFFSPNANPVVTGAALTDSLFKKYPAAKNKLQKYRAEFGPEITREDFVQVIWSEASSDLKKATALMSAK